MSQLGRKCPSLLLMSRGQCTVRTTILYFPYDRLVSFSYFSSLTLRKSSRTGSLDGKLRFRFLYQVLLSSFSSKRQSGQVLHDFSETLGSDKKRILSTDLLLETSSLRKTGLFIDYYTTVQFVPEIFGFQIFYKNPVYCL